ncbi:hypothetical protein N9X01_04060 [Candidatus Pelagibacter bacterium]|nr:hypothetical protein [Candidatus Pelagibacter bacterium]
MITNSIIYFFFIFITLSICKKFDFFLDIKDHNHKKFATKKKNYYIGGLFILIFLIYHFLNKLEYFYCAFFIIVFSIGLFADLKIFNNPKLRLLAQLFFLIFFIYLLDIKVPSTRIAIIDFLFEYDLPNYLFTIFCVAILINGTNFADGINTLMINYYIIILGIILFFFQDAIFDHYLVANLIILLSIILLFNIFGKIILGDSGAYILSLAVGLILIKFSHDNNFVSPYFIILLVWYPCFELLFSILRRLVSNFYSYKPDILHLHQIILKTINDKLKFKSNNLKHFLAGSIINTYNLFILMFALNYNDKTKIMLALIFVNIFVYISTYYLLRKKLKLAQN